MDDSLLGLLLQLPCSTLFTTLFSAALVNVLVIRSVSSSKPIMPRLIDSLPPPPPASRKSIQILVLGAPRTGTTSLTTALQRLGYKTYAGMSHSFRFENRYPHWTEATNLKYFSASSNKSDKLYTADDFDKILGGYETVCSWPAINFSDELLAAYPDAKVILTVRDADEWMDSIKATIWHIQTWNWEFIKSCTWSRARDFRLCAEACAKVWGFYDWRAWHAEEVKRRYVDHYEHVRDVVPKDKLLELSTGGNGVEKWKKLCTFLGKEVPIDEEWSRTQGKKSFVRTMKLIWWMGTLIGLLNVGGGIGIVVGVASVYQRWNS